ncbi:MAG: tRNA glutamyl-Q(34) synthetase GluQRS [Rhodobacteraceae bacterium]|nr:tRNA glutamyl-Q(34) synthetase GluQRS [Paracoccaceae bacterium]
MSYTTRFAPSPTGPLHLGHAFSALLAHDMARKNSGRFLLRIEDIDSTRSRPEWERLIFDDLEWLGITWDDQPLRQSERLPAYQDSLDHLWHERNLLYPCDCTRKDIEAALSAPQEGSEPAFGPDGLIYPGTCRGKTVRTGRFPKQKAMRLDMQDALCGIEGITFTETGTPAGGRTKTVHHCARELFQTVGDIVLSRKDFLGSYHLSVVLDDAVQGITDVVRGEDLFAATTIHAVLQRLLDLPTPSYHHHRLVRDEAGKRLAKRDDARAISRYRADGATPADIRRLVGL